MLRSISWLWLIVGGLFGAIFAGKLKAHLPIPSA